jgi:hypothetical protein
MASTPFDRVEFESSRFFCSNEGSPFYLEGEYICGILPKNSCGTGLGPIFPNACQFAIKGGPSAGGSFYFAIAVFLGNEA